MKTFNTFSAFAKHLDKVVNKHADYEAKAARFIGKNLEKEAKDKIGHLQDQVGPFAAWAELAESTKADKENKGYVFNHEYNPLYRTGELQDSIHYDWNPAEHHLRLGSSDEIMIYQELGTKYIPPRSVLGATMFQSPPLVNYTFGKMMVAWLENTTPNFRSGVYGSI